MCPEPKCFACCVSKRDSLTPIWAQEPASPFPLCPVCSAVGDEAVEARSLFRKHGLRVTEGFVGLSLCMVEYSAEVLVEAIKAQLVRNTAVEVMVHPGYREGGVGWDLFSADPSREKELEVLCGSRVKSLLEAAGIELVPYL